MLRPIKTWLLKGKPPEGMTYLKNIGGREGVNVVSTTIRNGRGNVLWNTRPFDTTDLFDWRGIDGASTIRELDYDGAPPLEYINERGVIWRCGKEQPFSFVPIDTIAYDSCIQRLGPSADIDGDGFLDAITFDYRFDHSTMMNVVLGGPKAGKGCARVANMEKVGYRTYRNVRAFFRTMAGTWRLIQYEKDSYDYISWLIIYDLNIVRYDNWLWVHAVARDSLHSSVISSTDHGDFGEAFCVTDTAAKREWLIMDHRETPTDPYTTKRFDITEGRFVLAEQLAEDVRYTGAYPTQNLDYSLGTDRPVIFMNRYLCYADNLHKPFARWKLSEDDPKYSGYGYPTVIDDQTGDGWPDFLGTSSVWTSTTGGWDSCAITLYSIDPPVSANEDDTPVPMTSSVRLMGDALELTLAEPAQVSAYVVGVTGESSLLVSRQHPAGITRIDLASYLWAYPRGVYVVRVRIGDVLHTAKLIR